MKYPDWLSNCNVKWEDLNPAYREYLLRIVGYEITNYGYHGYKLPDSPESQIIIKEWLYGKCLDTYVWCAKGFHQAKAAQDQPNTDAMDNAAQHYAFIHWLARTVYEVGVNDHWWDESITKMEFSRNYPWAERI